MLIIILNVEMTAYNVKQNNLSINLIIDKKSAIYYNINYIIIIMIVEQFSDRIYGN
jgi:hypothetical protein